MEKEKEKELEPKNKYQTLAKILVGGLIIPGGFIILSGYLLHKIYTNKKRKLTK